MELRKYFARPPEVRTNRPQADTAAAAVRDFVMVPATRAPAKVKAETDHFPYHKAHQRRPLLRPRRRRLTMVMVTLATGIALALLGWHLAGVGRPKLTENPLQTAQSSSKVKLTSAQAAEAPPSLPITHREAPRLEEKSSVLPPPALLPESLLRTPLPPASFDTVLKSPSKLGPPAPRSALVNAIWQPYRVFAPTYGETPMLHNWKMLKWASALAAAVAVTPAAFTQEKEDKVLEAIKELEKKVGDGFKKVQEDMDTLRPIVLGQGKDIDKLTERLGILEKKVADLESLKGRNIALYQSEKAAFDSMKDRLDQVEKALNGGKVTVKSIATTGRIVLQNRYPESLWFVINGKTYDVPANSDVVLDNQKLGPFSYEAWSPTYGRRAASTGVVNPDRPFTLLATLP
jgi:hypothetical protein